MKKSLFLTMAAILASHAFADIVVTDSITSSSYNASYDGNLVFKDGSSMLINSFTTCYGYGSAFMGTDITIENNAHVKLTLDAPTDPSANPYHLAGWSDPLHGQGHTSVLTIGYGAVLDIELTENAANTLISSVKNLAANETATLTIASGFKIVNNGTVRLIGNVGNSEGSLTLGNTLFDLYRGAYASPIRPEGGTVSPVIYAYRGLSGESGSIYLAAKDPLGEPVVPEPTTATLSLLGLVGLVARRKRK